MPVAINPGSRGNNPNSNNGIPNHNPGAPPARPTTISTRGGRRSRSPASIMMMGGPPTNTGGGGPVGSSMVPGAGNHHPHHHMMPTGSQPMPPPTAPSHQQHQQQQHPATDPGAGNPSQAAAAAAAAAAKAYASGAGPPPPGRWKPENSGGGGDPGQQQPHPADPYYHRGHPPHGPPPPYHPSGPPLSSSSSHHPGQHHHPTQQQHYGGPPAPPPPPPHHQQQHPSHQQHHPHHGPPPYGYDHRGGGGSGWPGAGEDPYATPSGGSSHRPRGDPAGGGPNSGGGGGSSGSRPYHPHYDPYGRPGAGGPPPQTTPPPPSQSPSSNSMGPPTPHHHQYPQHPPHHEMDGGRYGSSNNSHHPNMPTGARHPPSSGGNSSRSRYDHHPSSSDSRSSQRYPNSSSSAPPYHGSYHHQPHPGGGGQPPPPSHHLPSSPHPLQQPPHSSSSHQPTPTSSSHHHPAYAPQDYAGGGPGSSRYSNSSAPPSGGGPGGSDRGGGDRTHHSRPGSGVPPTSSNSSTSSRPHHPSSSSSRPDRGGAPTSSSVPPSTLLLSTSSSQQQRSSPSHSSSSGGGGTTIVIGGATPIHLPKPSVSTPSSATPNDGTKNSPKNSIVTPSATKSTASITTRTTSPIERPSVRSDIFRNRSSDIRSNSSNKAPPSRGRSSSSSDSFEDNVMNNMKVKDPDDSPQNILLSLRTPTTSFEGNDFSSSIKIDRRDKNSRSSALDSSHLDDDDTIHRKNSINIPGQNRQSPTTNRKSPDNFYESRRSNDFLKSNGSIDMTPSFNILNASFDSLTDVPYFTLDSTLGQTDSFGGLMGRTDSIGGNNDPQQILRRNSSVGNYSSTQIVTTGSTPGIGYSPVNSFVSAFGDPSGSGPDGGGYRRSGGGSNIMVVGGSSSRDPYREGSQARHHQRGRSTAPVGGPHEPMYRTYSGGGGGGFGGTPGPLDDSHLQMSVGSFGYSRSYGEPASPVHYRSRSPENMEPYYPHNSSSGSGHRHSSNPYRSQSPSFYVALKRHREAFRECTFLLPGLKAALLEEPAIDQDETDANQHASKWDHESNTYGFKPEPIAQDSTIARRRIECSVCAFGGNLNQDTSSGSSDKDQIDSSDRDSIFRDKDSKKQKQPLPTVTPSSTESLSKGKTEPNPSRIKYEEKLASRYYENESRLSWEFEEEPPIEVPEHTSEIPTVPYKENRTEDDDDDEDDNYELVDETANHNDDREEKPPKVKSDQPDAGKEGSSVKVKIGEPGGGELVFCQATGTDDFRGSSPSPTATGSKARSEASSPTKMRYRCKLCGQPKQNHRCPYQQSLARSIGVMVYPAVNAFTADEPGTIAAPLSEMNNFFDIQKQESHLGGDASVGGASAEATPDRHTGHHVLMGAPSSSSITGVPASSMVSPDSLRSSSNNEARSPTHQYPYSGGHSQSSHPSHHQRSSSARSVTDSVHSSGGDKKRSYSQMNDPAPSRGMPDDSTNQQGDLLFLDAMELKPEQFKMVSPSSTKALRSADVYKYPGLPLPYAQRKRLSDNLFSLSNEVPKLTDECASVLREAREKKMWDLAVAELMTQVIVVLHCPAHDDRLEGLRQYLLTLGIAC